ncbi:MAG: ABC transporter permease [Hydrogenophilales bacterium CG_4_9_14_3_um_filter_63_34]|nr:MAG: ABC transporter permease [Hydrogenophilales bacterium CG_4_10_14_3_um_filter_63_21]PJB07870.1 MAG: ABC transporter permease [Hydrogenophilales bacterium CG_4_9_14_3_um_filter_63_34]
MTPAVGCGEERTASAARHRSTRFVPRHILRLCFFSAPRITAWAIATLTLIPVLVVASALLDPDQEIWAHLWRYTLPELLVNTVWLALGVGLGVSLLGITLAWLTAACEFPGRRFFTWALLLPLALPAYVTAFVWLGLLDFTGSLPTWLREAWGIQHLPPIRSRGGVILVLALALYPYVYLTARSAFQGQGRRLMEAAQSLGLSPVRGFFRVALPMARPGIVAGLSLALMETLADFGTVSVFNYNTFTTAIYKAWFSLFSLPAASQLASILIFFVLVLVLLEQVSRQNKRYAHSARGGGGSTRIHLAGWRGWLVASFAGLVFLLAFAVPFTQLLIWAWYAAGTDLDPRYFAFIGHSLLLSGLGALLVATLAVALGYAQRLQPTPGMVFTARLATIGYALPGAVLAVGFFIPVAWADNLIIDQVRAWTGREVGQILGGTLAVMLLAYCARFLAVGFSSVEAGLGRITRSLDEAAEVLGVTGLKRLRRVHLPMLRVPLLAALALTFVDIMKELPITLMTRPFGWDTLATRIFEMTSEGEWERAALPAVAIAIVGLLPIFFLIRDPDAKAC